MDDPIISLLHRAVQRSGNLFAAKFGDGSITPRQFEVLRAVSMVEGANQTLLVDLTGIDRSTMADLVRRLLKKGLLLRRRSKKDSRSYVIALSADGKTTLENANPLSQQVNDELLSRLSKTQGKDFAAALRLIIEDESGAR